MQRAANTSRFLINFFSNREIADSESVVSNGGLLQYIVSHIAQSANSRQLFNELAPRLIRVAEHAFSLRDVNALREASQVLMNLPLIGAKQIGHYYHSLAISRDGKKSEALALLEKVADKAPLAYRSRALQTLGSIYHRQDRFDEALWFYGEALQVSSSNNGRDLLTTLTAYLNISGIKSLNGDHQGAFTDLEKLLPIARIVAKQSPLYFYFYHADLAYELAQVGRIAEAEAACAIALASPFAAAYPEWSDTRDEIAAKRQSASPSVVAINRALETETACNPELKGEINQVKAVALGWLSEYQTFQKAIALTGASAAIAKDELPQVVLDRVGKSVQARAPPLSPK